MNSGLTDAKNAWLAIATPIQSTIQILQQVGQTAKQAYEFISEGTKGGGHPDWRQAGEESNSSS